MLSGAYRSGMATCWPWRFLAFLPHTDGSSEQNRIVQRVGAGLASFLLAGAWPHTGRTADRTNRPATLMEVGMFTTPDRVRRICAYAAKNSLVHSGVCQMAARRRGGPRTWRPDGPPVRSPRDVAEEVVGL